MSEKADGSGVVKFIDSAVDNRDVKIVENVGSGIHGTQPVAARGGSAEKIAAEQLTVREGGKTPTGQLPKKSNVGDRAIVQVLDRVNTPPTESQFASAADGYNSVASTTAFSVLPDAERSCKCPECREKFPRSSLSKPSKGPINI